MKIIYDTRKKTIEIQHGHNSKVNSAPRIEFIKNNFPEVMTCDPYRSPTLLKRIREALVDNGYYAKSSYNSSHVNDETLIKYILKVKGQKIKSRCEKPPKQEIFEF